MTTSNSWEDVGIEVYDLWFADGVWFIDEDDYEHGGNVIAWCELPAPYKPKGE